MTSWNSLALRVPVWHFKPFPIWIWIPNRNHHHCYFHHLSFEICFELPTIMDTSVAKAYHGHLPGNFFISVGLLHVELTWTLLNCPVLSLFFHIVPLLSFQLRPDFGQSAGGWSPFPSFLHRFARPGSDLRAWRVRRGRGCSLANFDQTLTWKGGSMKIIWNEYTIYYCNVHVCTGNTSFDWKGIIFS